ncbi:MAG: RNA polymerase sigma factor WhiG, partial [Actinobacteria bacterium]|nr:RNA polymerase sigma factor WhiG [Actinomycetota bacterium]
MSTKPEATDDDFQDKLDEIWAEYKADGAVRARERLILHYAPLVKYVASRVATGLPGTIEQA